MREEGITELDFVLLYKKHGRKSVKRSPRYVSETFGRNRPRGSFYDGNGPAQFMIYGKTTCEDGRCRLLEAIYNIEEPGGEIIVFHFDKDEGGKILKEMNRTRNMKLNEREEHEGEPVITFSDGVSLTLSQYDEYLKQQNAWIDSLPEITPEDGELYDYWISLQDEVAKENGETDGDGLPKAATVGKDEFLFV